MPLRNFTHGTLTISDDSGKSVVVGPGAGNVNIQGLEADNREQEAVYDRGTFLERVPKSKKKYTVTVQIMHNGKLTDNTTETVMDALRGTGAFQSGTTVDPGGIVWALDVELVIDRAGETDTLLFGNARPVADYSEGDPTNSISVQFECVEDPVIS